MTNIRYAIPVPSSVHIEPRGRLLNEPAYFALWYFLRCAHIAVKETPEQLTLTDEDDKQSDLRQIVDSICLIADVTPSEMFDSEVWRRAQLEAEACKLSIHYKVAAFINSGGQTYRHYDRDPDSHTQGDE